MMTEICSTCSKMIPSSARRRYPDVHFSAAERSDENPVRFVCPHCGAERYAPTARCRWWCACQLCSCPKGDEFTLMGIPIEPKCSMCPDDAKKPAVLVALIQATGREPRGACVCEEHMEVLAEDVRRLGSELGGDVSSAGGPQ